MRSPNGADVVAVVVLGLLSAWNLWNMSQAETIIDTLKTGFLFLAVINQLVGAMNRGAIR